VKNDRKWQQPALHSASGGAGTVQGLQLSKPNGKIVCEDTFNQPISILHPSHLLGTQSTY
jgi:hypothetical protein